MYMQSAQGISLRTFMLAHVAFFKFSRELHQYSMTIDQKDVTFRSIL